MLLEYMGELFRCTCTICCWSIWGNYFAVPVHYVAGVYGGNYFAVPVYYVAEVYGGTISLYLYIMLLEYMGETISLYLYIMLLWGQLQPALWCDGFLTVDKWMALNLHFSSQ